MWTAGRDDVYPEQRGLARTLIEDVGEMLRQHVADELPALRRQLEDEPGGEEA